jgi:hypothetical protein
MKILKSNILLYRLNYIVKSFIVQDLRFFFYSFGRRYLMNAKPGWGYTQVVPIPAHKYEARVEKSDSDKTYTVFL